MNLNTDEDLPTAVGEWSPAVDASDNSEMVTLTSNYDSGDTFPIGQTEVTFTARDPSNNEVMASFFVTVTGS